MGPSKAEGAGSDMVTRGGGGYLLEIRRPRRTYMTVSAVHLTSRRG